MLGHTSEAAIRSYLKPSREYWRDCHAKVIANAARPDELVNRDGVLASLAGTLSRGSRKK